jgi:hypothetical protein
MKIPLPIHFTLLITIALLLTLMLAPGWSAVQVASAQVPAAETTVTEQATATFTSIPPTATVTNTPIPGATATNTPEGPTNTPTQIATLPPDETATPSPTPVSGPVPIPEPVTVILFGTGLAALSAAVASRRKKDE